MNFYSNMMITPSSLTIQQLIRLEDRVIELEGIRQVFITPEEMLKVRAEVRLEQRNYS
jgi:hypothetical protein